MNPQLGRKLNASVRFGPGSVVIVIASVCASLVAAHVTKSAHRVDALETQSLTIVDETNRPVAVLSSNSADLVLFDKQRKKRTELFLEPNGTPDLYLYDAAGKPRASLNLYFSGVPNLEFVGSSENATGPSPLLESLNRERSLAFHEFENKRIADSLAFRTGAAGPILELTDGAGKHLWSTATSHY
jgi:hypothetical protein